MPQIGPMEIMIVAIVALIVFGPQRLPEIARTVGRTLSELRRQAADIRGEFEAGIDSFDPKLDEDDDEDKGRAVEPALDPAAGDASSDVTAGAETGGQTAASQPGDDPPAEGDEVRSPQTLSSTEPIEPSPDVDELPHKPSRAQPDMRPDR